MDIRAIGIIKVKLYLARHNTNLPASSPIQLAYQWIDIRLAPVIVDPETYSPAAACNIEVLIIRYSYNTVRFAV